MSNAIEFNNVWKKFRKGEKFNSLRDAVPNLFKAKSKEVSLSDQEFWAVKDVSFQIKKGDVVGIMGPNGAGKSTILKLLSRIIVPTKGSMTINGRLSALIEVTAGFHPELTGRENVYLNGTILGMRKKEIDANFDEIVEFSGVGGFIDTPVKRYSSGMYSRLGFSVAAHMNPEILLVDEVLAVGDIAFQAKCAQKMRDLLKSGATIILVSHQLNMIQSLCKRVILLQSGQLINDGTVDQVIPIYENIVYKKSEIELREKINSADERVRIDTSTLVDITNVSFKETVFLGDPLTIDIEYIAKQKIDSPIFIVNIMRADGVVCCSSRTDQENITITHIEGKGLAHVDFGRNILAAGIYMVKISIWDKEMVHPYTVRGKDVLRVEIKGKSTLSEAIFVPEVRWTMN